ncbi:hypothetical protein ElyMa_003365800 [Elysia marginata]|uniref:Secreted protein n=1 Tax=Elysia marginata TaxID=1093978 RepID=A0AAV4JIL0_9GAST|nr:hypothetical protein ElyMa_003365800 [Elysia marginata]
MEKKVNVFGVILLINVLSPVGSRSALWPSGKTLAQRSGGKINGKKSRGRQRTTYVDSLNTWANLEQHTRSQFMRSSCERQIWKTMTVNACSRHGT